MSPEVINSVKNVSISAAPLTDHCVIDLSLKAGNNSTPPQNIGNLMRFVKCRGFCTESKGFIGRN